MVAGSMNETKCYFESGYLTKSPCRGCSLKNELPGCANTCRTLSQIQVLLAGLIPRINRFSEYEEYSLISAIDCRRQ